MKFVHTQSFAFNSKVKGRTNEEDNDFDPLKINPSSLDEEPMNKA